MIAMTNECGCGAAIDTSRYVCPTCVGRLDRALGDCHWIDDELDTTITRQRSAAIGSGSSSADKGIPWHERASDAKRTLHGLLVSWVRFAIDEDLAHAPDWSPRDNIPSLSRWLLHVTRDLAGHDIGPEAVNEITDAVAECERIVFWKRRSRVYLGTCEQAVTDDEGETVTLSCEGDVYAEEGDQVGHCEECGQGVTVVIRKAQIEDRLDSHLFTPAEIATCAVHLGLDVPRERVRQRVVYWHRRKLISPHGSAENGDPMFRYGDVRQMLYSEFGRQSA